MEITKIINALMDDDNTISVYFSTPVDISVSRHVYFIVDKEFVEFTAKSVANNRLVIITQTLNIKRLHHVMYAHQMVEVIPHNVLDKFYYAGNDLGLTYTKKQSTFKVFAPTSSKIVLNLYKTLESTEKETFPLTETVDGIWEVILDRDLKGLYYSYSVEGASSLFNPNIDAIDPYAKCVVGKTGKALVIDLNDYVPAISYAATAKLEDSVIYEIHIRDISIDKSAGCQQKGKFQALLEDETILNKDDATIRTLAGHCKELGVNTLQIMPLQDFDNDEQDANGHNWGYMPRFFDSPDGSYASNWQTDAKIAELKELVNFLHKNDFKLILDVVYNHTAEGFTKDSIFSFNAFVPYYYYRFNNGDISNGSGCGNELRSESPMTQKFIIDSMKFWTEFYGFDGYRFDLMGLIDLATIEKVISELRKINSNIMIYGEPWTCGATPIHVTSKGMQKNKGFSVFNDNFRDTVKGHVFYKKGKGYIQSNGHYHNYDAVLQGILGSINTFTAAPPESLNYVEIHDNHTLFDRLYYSLSEQENFSYPSGILLEKIIAMHKLAGFILLTSQGIPVLHLGQDFLRTKLGVENSYNAGDYTNKIDWNRKKEFYDVFLYYKNLIELKKQHPLLKITSDPGLREAIDFNREHFPSHKGQGIAYVLEGGRKWGDSCDKLLVLINPYAESVTLNLKDSHWKKLLFGWEYFKNNHPIAPNALALPALSGNILFQ